MSLITQEGCIMNIWDSVQRGLEKATQEATRRARTLRLRSTIDTVTQQIHTQEDDLIVRTMELFAAGKLTQSELLPLCQTLTSLQQQLEQAQHELNLVQSQGQTQLPPTTSAVTTPIPPYTTPPSNYEAYDQTMPAPPPPPPPGVTEFSAFSTMQMGTPGTGKRLCMHCQAELIPGNAYCHNCGAPTEQSEIAQQPTTLVAPPEEAKQHTTPTGQLSATADQKTPPDDLPTIEINEPNRPIAAEEKNRGD
jgi:hypothetical protein